MCPKDGDKISLLTRPFYLQLTLPMMRAGLLEVLRRAVPQGAAGSTSPA